MFKQVDSTCKHIELEHEMLKFWTDTDAFEKLRKQNKGNKKWSFLDGPITANNPMGVHHAWGRTLKDCYQRYHAMLGCEQRYQNGFDCQGLWVEVEVEKEMGFETKADIERNGLEEFTNRCKARVEKYSEIQTEQSKRLGYWMDWDNSYYTMSDENNYTIWSFLKKCHNRGYVYKGLDAMPWCPRCETGISEQEKKEGYKTVEDTALYVEFPLVGRDNEALIIWTTTPWTLAANVAAAVNPELTYVKVKQGDKFYYVAEALVSVLKEKGEHTVIEKILGKDMIGWEYTGPFDEFPIVKETFDEVGYTHRVIPWQDVSDTSGVGIVHIAPGCGKEDFDLGKELKLPMLMPIDDTGAYVEGFGFLEGKNAGEVADVVMENLREKKIYYKKERFSHEYPHCWRCKTPLLFRSVDEWYINMDWRDEIKDVVKQIKWIPEWGHDQELNWLENMGDWMISKKRFWGLALPIFECECGWHDVIGSKEELKEKTIEGWDKFEGNSPHRPWVDHLRIKCEKCGKPVKRIADVGNPWLDAGIVPYSTTGYNTDRKYWEEWMPADLVLECFPGQFRNWFYALLSMSTMMENIPPFKTLLGHALVRDEHGQEMHKSTGNAIWFDEAAEKMGADVMRWMYCGQNPTNNMNFGYTPGDQVRRRVFSTWWNVYSFFVNYARLDGFDPNKEAVPYEQLQDIDKWLLSKLQELIEVGHKAMTDFAVMQLVQKAEEFIERLSNWYVRRNRRRFWRAKNDSDVDKLAAYQTLYKVLTELCKIVAPISPFMTENMYQNLVRPFDANAPESIHHCKYPEVDQQLRNPKLAADMDMIADVVSRGLSIRETKKLRVRQPLAKLVAVGNKDDAAVLEQFKSHVLEELNIKELETVPSLDEFVTYTLKPDRRLLGPKLGKDMKTVMDILKTADAGAIAAKVNAGQGVTIEGDGKSFELEANELIVECQYPDTLVVSNNVQPHLVLDVDITHELMLEGLARDLVRHIQQTRKDSGFEIQDHISVGWDTTDKNLKEAFDAHKDYICGETLCDKIQDVISDGQPVEITIGKATLSLSVKKI
ncbi:MAG: isoleucine--tRNA ligase [Phycisphaerae bacterium]|nr:isoleucine--tRNA ligase [Phycisphaerae bacterium]